jgi:opine dehydrogenase
LRQAGHRRPVTSESTTLPYICRKLTGERVKISRRARKLKFAVFPAKSRAELAERLKPLFPAISPVPTLLDTVFSYTNAIHHPPALLCNIGRVESTQGDYCYYYDGITPSVGRIIDALDAERLKLAQTFGCDVDRLADYFFDIGYTDENGRVGGTAYSTFHNSEPNRWIKAPETVDHRFFNEDIPFGLVPLTELGRLAGVSMPASEAVIELASIATGKPYRETGLTLERMGIDGLTIPGLKTLLDQGYGP